MVIKFLVYIYKYFFCYYRGKFVILRIFRDRVFYFVWCVCGGGGGDGVFWRRWIYVDDNVIGFVYYLC